jgi:ADP-ribose pyrophosphatase YjhB (NUDIX family)
MGKKAGGGQDKKEGRKATTPPKARTGMSLQNVMDDLNVRFIINIPDEELASLERVFFQVEAAHWFYDDFYRVEHKHLPSLRIKEFSQAFVRRCPTLKSALKLKDDEAVAAALNSFTKYKRKVPVCGCILLNTEMNECVLVKGWIAGSNWGFPKGKINADEPELDCAVREVLEETGFDASQLVNEGDFLEHTDQRQRTRLYVARGVPCDFAFATQTRKEISEIKWFDVDALSQGSTGADGGLSSHASHFTGQLVDWIRKNGGSVVPEKAAKSKRKKGKKAGTASPCISAQPDDVQIADGVQQKQTQKPKPKRRGSQDSDKATFGDDHDAKGWSVKDMFAVNEEKFGIVNTFNIDDYSVPLPDAETQAKALQMWRQSQQAQGKAAQGKGRGRGRGQSVSPQLQPQRKHHKGKEHAEAEPASENLHAPSAELAPSVASVFERALQGKLATLHQGHINNIPNHSKTAATSVSCGAGVKPASSFAFNREEIMSCI